MLGAALQIVDWNARVLAFDHSVEGFIEGKVGGQGKNIGTRDHDFADGDAVEFDGVVDHLFLRFGNLAELAAGRDNEFEFIGRVDRAAAAGFAGAEEAQHQATGTAHEEKQRAGEGEECFHGRCNGEGDLLGALQGQGFRDEFAEENVQVSDETEGDYDGDAMSIDRRVWHFVNEAETFDEAGHHGFADPA